MFPDTIVSLGSFVFSRTEVPEKIPFGGEQKLVVHELVGGDRVVDAMGRSDAPLSWSGIFTGPTAVERARYLDGLRILGRPHILTWGEMIYEVVISSFEASYERFYRIPYRITCTVVRDLGGVVTWIAPPAIDDLLFSDMTLAGLLGDLIQDTPLLALLSDVNLAMGAVASFPTATMGQVASVLTPIAAVQSRLTTLTNAANATLGAVATVGGIAAGLPIETQALNMAGQLSAMQQLPSLLNLQGVMGRMAANLEVLSTAGASKTMAGGNLFAVAAEEYGDATAWTTIARANGLFDPDLNGINTINIPSLPEVLGGILDA